MVRHVRPHHRPRHALRRRLPLGVVQSVVKTAAVMVRVVPSDAPNLTRKLCAGVSGVYFLPKVGAFCTQNDKKFVALVLDGGGR